MTDKERAAIELLEQAGYVVLYKPVPVRMYCTDEDVPFETWYRPQTIIEKVS